LLRVSLSSSRMFLCGEFFPVLPGTRLVFSWPQAYHMAVVVIPGREEPSPVVCVPSFAHETAKNSHRGKSAEGRVDVRPPVMGSKRFLVGWKTTQLFHACWSISVGAGYSEVMMFLARGPWARVVAKPGCVVGGCGASQVKGLGVQAGTRRTCC